MRYFLALILCLLPAAIFANAGIAVQSLVFVERQSKAPDGKIKVKLEAPTKVVPGDRLVFIVSFANHGRQPATNFYVTNPIPRAVAFQATADLSAQLSVNGGRTWGKITQLKVVEIDGRIRSARVEDVTHIRWPLTRAIAVGEAGKLSFRGIVR